MWVVSHTLEIAIYVLKMANGGLVLYTQLYIAHRIQQPIPKLRIRIPEFSRIFYITKNNNNKQTRLWIMKI